MNAQRAQEIYDSSDRIEVHLDEDGDSVWIEKVDVANGVATVQVGPKPVQTMTVGVERLIEKQQ
jgi:small acid-soluble spore protein H (minor)